jgi:hypothetical protein
MRYLSSTGRALRRGVIGLILVLAAAIGVLAPAGPATATTGDSMESQVWLNLGAEPSDQLRIDYSTFLASLRAAVGDARQGVEVTQESTGHAEGIVRVLLTADDDSGNERGVYLWIQPDNLYVVGYSPRDTPNVSYALNDTSSSRWFPTDSVQRLPFGGNYQSLTGAANRNRDTTPIAFWNVRQAVIDLANQQSVNGNPQTTARALLLLIQFTSEAARFNDVEGIFRNVMASWDNTYNGVPDWLQHMENNWGTLSNFFWNSIGLGSNSNPDPVTIGTGASQVTISNATDARRYLRTVLPPNEGPSYSAAKLEL